MPPANTHSHDVTPSPSQSCSPTNVDRTLTHDSRSNGKGKSRADTESIDESGGEWCLICHSSPLSDRTVLPTCLHAQFCFGCILRWANIKRKCPLCLADLGEYVIHQIRADDDFVRYFFPPLPPSTTTASASSQVSSSAERASSNAERRRVVREVQRARSLRHHPLTTDLEEQQQERALEFRKEIYRHGLYAKHVGSNRFTGYRVTPTPAQIKRSFTCDDGDGKWGRRISTFTRRELSIWPNLDVEFLTKYIVSLLQVFDVTADETVRLVGEFLGEKVGRHFLHELQCWLRSGKQRLSDYDRSPYLQYFPYRGKEERRGEGEGVSFSGEHNGVRTESSREDVAARRATLLERLERERSMLARTGGRCGVE